MRPLMEFFVAGLIHSDFNLLDLPRNLRRGDRLDMRRDVENPVDPFALVLLVPDHGFRRLGFVPKTRYLMLRTIVSNLPTPNWGPKAHIRILNVVPTNPSERMVLVGLCAGRHGDFDLTHTPDLPKPKTYRKLII